MSQLRRGLKPFSPEKHARFKSMAEYGFSFDTPVYPIDKTGGLTDLGMGGNGPDRTLTVNGGKPAGNCGPNAVPKNVDQTTAVIWGVAATAMTSNQIMALYFIYQAELAGISWRPSGDDWVAPDDLDQGVDLGDWLLWLLTHDIDGNKVDPGEGLIEAFAKIELSDLDAALSQFSAVVVGVSLNHDADEQCEEGKPWDIGPGDEPDPSEGHAITFAAAATSSGPYKWGTWGQFQPSTYAWKQKCPQQAFVVLTKDEAEAANFPMAELVADLKALGGTA